MDNSTLAENTSELDEWDSKASTVINLAHTLAGLLLDPTVGGKSTLSTEGRTKVREEAHNGLTLCLDSLESIILSYAKYDEIASIAAKYINESTSIAKQDSNRPAAQ